MLEEAAMTKVFLLTRPEFAAAEEARMALGTRRNRNELQDGRQGASLGEILRPGAMWEAFWYFDPAGGIEMEDRRKKVLARIEAGEARRDYLSVHYWRDWSLIRPPLCVLCPNGEEWCIDAGSSNGTGWTVTGTAPLVTAAPSIVVDGYHGFLQNGVFTPDIENRGSTGTRRLGPYQGK